MQPTSEGYLDSPSTRVFLSAPDLIAPHVVHFYESDAVLIDRLVGFIHDSMANQGAWLVIGTAAHRAALELRLNETGLNLVALKHSGAYVAASLQVGSAVHGQRHARRPPIRAGGRAALELAGANGRRVRAFGEMVALLVADGRGDAALALEALWNGLQSRYPFVLFCAYSLDLMADARDDTLIRDVCLTHGQVIPGKSFLRLTDEESRDRLVVELQQRSRWLEARDRGARASRGCAKHVPR